MWGVPLHLQMLVSWTLGLDFGPGPDFVDFPDCCCCYYCFLLHPRSTGSTTAVHSAVHSPNCPILAILGDSFDAVVVDDVLPMSPPVLVYLVMCTSMTVIPYMDDSAYTALPLHILCYTDRHVLPVVWMYYDSRSCIKEWCFLIHE
jgi:hypothetical protein